MKTCRDVVDRSESKYDGRFLNTIEVGRRLNIGIAQITGYSYKWSLTFLQEFSHGPPVSQNVTHSSRHPNNLNLPSCFISLSHFTSAQIRPNSHTSDQQYFYLHNAIPDPEPSLCYALCMRICSQHAEASHYHIPREHASGCYR